jgi:ribosomal 50S subunit-recycling heat shock protein
MIIKIDDNIYIKFNQATRTSETIDLGSLEEQKAQLESSIQVKTDEELLAWAKENYYSPTILAMQESKTKELEKVNALLNEIYGN